MNVSGHRLSTAEIEAALIEHHGVAEAAVVGVADELTGQAVNAFVAIKDGTESSEALRKEFILQVRKSIGPFAAPKAVYVVPDLPKTRSGKIMRRILRKILAGEEDQLGDVTTVRFFISLHSMSSPPFFGLYVCRGSCGLTLNIVVRPLCRREDHQCRSRGQEEMSSKQRRGRQ